MRIWLKRIKMSRYKHTINCPLCNKFFTGEVFETHIDGRITYTLYECSMCKAQFWLPLKNPGADWYEHDERYVGANSSPILEPNWNHKKTVSFFKGREGSVLDIGSGTGNFLSHALENGWNVTGIDFDSNAVRAAQTVFNLPNISVSDIYSFKERNIKIFDLVTFFDVFEHIDDHHLFLKSVHELLKDGGHIAMSVPYRDGSRWLQPNDLPPRHLTRWNRTSIKYFLENNGFEIVCIDRMHIEFFYIVMKLRFKYGKWASLGLVTKTKDTNKVNSKVVKSRHFKSLFIHLLAKTKDIILFGIPAGIIWLSLLPSKRKYIGLYVIAKKK